jgi:hypothetical protein
MNLTFIKVMNGAIVSRNIRTDFRKNKYQSKKPQLFLREKMQNTHTAPPSTRSRRTPHSIAI